MRNPDPRTLYRTAVGGFAFLGVTLAGLVLAAAAAFAVPLGRAPLAAAAPDLVAGLLAAGAGAAGYVLAREHTRALLEREGLMVELEGEFERLGDEIVRLRDVQTRTAERLRIESETLKEFVKEQRLALDVVEKRLARHGEAVDVLDHRLGDVEAAVGRKPSVRLEVSR